MDYDFLSGVPGRWHFGKGDAADVCHAMRQLALAEALWDGKRMPREQDAFGLREQRPQVLLGGFRS